MVAGCWSELLGGPSFEFGPDFEGGSSCVSLVEEARMPEVVGTIDMEPLEISLPEAGSAPVTILAHSLLLRLLAAAPCVAKAERRPEDEVVIARLSSGEEVGSIPRSLFRGYLARYAVWLMNGQVYGGYSRRCLVHDGKRFVLAIHLSNEALSGFWFRFSVASQE